MNVIQALEVEVRRVKKVIAKVEARTEIAFAASSLRAVVERCERAIADRDAKQCDVFLDEIREIKLWREDDCA
jgi:hypothetical protein